MQSVLQAQDGTFFGVVWYDWDPNDIFLASFDKSGNIKWTAPNYYAQIATADGGVIAGSYNANGNRSGQSFTFDANGNSTSQLASLPMQSWMGNEYQLGSINQMFAIPYNYATSYAATAGGSPVPFGTYVPSLGAIYRSQIASDAKGYVGNSTTWKEGFPNPSVTCNIFVSAVLQQASDETNLNIPVPTRPPRERYGLTRIDAFLAADWANPHTNAGCWKPLPAGPDGAIPGDVIATGYPTNGPDGTGHVGIVVEPDSGTPNYRDSSAADVPPYWWTNAQKQSFIPGTITLTDYGFRLSGFDFTDPSDNQGLKQDSYVRRFVCYQ